MSTQKLPDDMLITNADGSIYHLALLPDDIGHDIILVGDPARVAKVSSHFDRVDIIKKKREFITHTGELGGKRLTVISTGIGVGNIDIVMNELDALVNIDLAVKEVKSDLTSLRFYRIGTSGSIREEIEVDSILVNLAGITLDPSLQFYESIDDMHSFLMEEAFSDHVERLTDLVVFPVAGMADKSLLEKMAGFRKGISYTATGFYGPQGRMARKPLSETKWVECLQTFKHEGMRITNMEMETASIYAMAKLLGHKAVSINAILANRANHTFSKNPAEVVMSTIKKSLELIIS